MRLACSADPKGRNLLQEELATADPSISAVSALLDNSSERVAVRNEHGSTALHVACQSINSISIDIINLLIAASPASLASPNSLGLLPIHKAVAALGHPNLEVIKAVVEGYSHGFQQPTKNGQLPLYCAVSFPKRPSVGTVTLLLSYYPEAAMIANNFGHLPLHKAVGKTNIDVQVVEELLVVARVSPAVKDKAGYGRLTGSIFMLIAYKCFRNIALHWALARDRPNNGIVQLLMQAYPEGVLERDNNGNRPVDRLEV